MSGYDYTLKRPEDIPPSTPDVGPGPAPGGITINLTDEVTTVGNLYKGTEEPTDPTPAEGDVWVDTTGGAPFQIKTFANDEWVIAPLIAKDGAGVVTASVVVEDDGSVELTGGVEMGSVIRILDTGAIHMSAENDGILLGISSAGAIQLERGVATIGIGTGTDIINVSTGSASVSLEPDGTVIVSAGEGLLELSGLPLADPGSDGVWNNGGIVTVGPGA